MTWTDWVFTTYGFLTPWHVALLTAIVVVTWRCRDRRAAALATTGWVLLLVTSMVAAGLTMTLISSGLFNPVDETLRLIDTATVYAWRYGNAVGLTLVILAVFIGRRVKASR